MNLSFVILTWNSEKHIKQCLYSIFAHLGEQYKPFEIFVVDNGSEDGTVDIIKSFSVKYPDIIKTIFLAYNTGTTYSRNLALRKVAGEVIAVLDSDIIVSKGFIKPLLETLTESDNIGMVVPKLVYGDGRFQKSTDDFPTLFSKIRRYLFLRKIEQREESQFYEGNQKVDYAISAFWLFKRQMLSDVGLLDEKIFYAPEDVDYCLRIWQAGYEIVYVPRSEIIHNAQEISRGFKLNRTFWEHLKGLFYFFGKNKYLFQKPSF